MKDNELERVVVYFGNGLIDLAPSMKPNRHTYLHEEKYRELGKKILIEDEVLKKVFG